MITKMKQVYYCEHCGKRYLAKWAMNRHEPACTLNPNRICGLCCFPESIGERAILISPRFDLDGQAAIDEVARVYDEAGNCPNCMLAIIRQSKQQLGICGENTFSAWDYKAEMVKWWEDVNESNRKADEEAIYNDIMRESL